jgi:hypothetical protein
VEANGTTTEATETTEVDATTTEDSETTEVDETTTGATETTEADGTTTGATETTEADGTTTGGTSARTIGPAPNVRTPILPSGTPAIAVKRLVRAAVAAASAAAGTPTVAIKTTEVDETTTEDSETTEADETTTEDSETTEVDVTTTEDSETTEVDVTTTEGVETVSGEPLPTTIGLVPNATIQTSRSETSATDVKNLDQAVEAEDNEETGGEAVIVNEILSVMTEEVRGDHRVDAEDLDSRTDERPIPLSEDRKGSVPAMRTTNHLGISEIRLVNLNDTTIERT